MAVKRHVNFELTEAASPVKAKTPMKVSAPAKSCLKRDVSKEQARQEDAVKKGKWKERKVNRK